MSSSIQTRFITVDGVRSSSLSAGPSGAAEAVVFVHGNPGPGEDWRRLVAATDAFTRVVAFDVPGCVRRRSRRCDWR